ncbi:DUF402 domain-containing protein [Saccharopolyspora rhizosphaerae]|uniref:DUF402 domain-containing protein n=1 Tax=Saccharopolyspora rhizosphaerae TaxID=2492662 RepID=A0A426JWZ7_9PSEU|nr:DUF402 domain-containing protein [Saccharopolyspora rhizosphaerae]RRO17623.1 DUF402 domain-containing protein [Saccharopolyspora rhizosphaerae]
MTTQREIAERLGLPVHPPKTEVFDLVAGTNTDPKGHVRTVSRYRREPFGLYLARPLPGQPTIAALESWLLPSLGLRVTRWYWRPGHERDLDFYLDLVDIRTGDAQWRTEDHYLDLEVRQGRDVHLLDVDEFVLAVRSAQLDSDTAEGAMRRACAALEGITRCGYDLSKWLRDNGIELSWEGQPLQGPVPEPRSLPPSE